MSEWNKSTYCESGTCVEVSFTKSTFSVDNGTCVEVGFVKSSYSGNNGACVEVAFTKSSKSGPHTDNCVEVGQCDCGIKVRDSKDPDGPVLTFNHAEWSAFLAGVRNDEFNL
jgi:hypothetical protein